MKIDLSRNANAFKLFTALCSGGFLLAGSRRALGQYPQYETALEESDYDFICPATPKNLALLKKLGFDRKDLLPEYTDITTIDVYERIVSGIKIQVAVKHEKYWKPCTKMWEFLSENPEVFAQSFWKRNVPKHQIKTNINYMITNVFCFMS